MNEHVLVGFGFGPIQGGLFVSEASKSGCFNRMVIAEIDPKIVEAIRANRGAYQVNVAGSSGISTECIHGVEIYNPAAEADRQELLKALTQATEIVTSLPSVSFYDIGEHSVASLIAQGLKNNTAKATILYTAENNNHAAEILEEKVKEYSGKLNKTVQFLNTVIGKMSQVVMDKKEIVDKNLNPIAPGIDRAFLVEEFNRILVTKCTIPEFRPGVQVFLEKEDLLPFEEAKLYGHNAIHALLAYLGSQKGYKKMSEIENDAEIMRIAEDAFIHESGKALIQKYEHLNEELFTPTGYRAYAEDLLRRMINPWLGDTVERAARDPQRKLGLNDRLFGTMALCLERGIQPKNLALAAAAGIAYYIKQTGRSDDLSCQEILSQLWKNQSSPYRAGLIKHTETAFARLPSLTNTGT